MTEKAAVLRELKNLLERQYELFARLADEATDEAIVEETYEATDKVIDKATDEAIDEATDEQHEQHEQQDTLEDNLLSDDYTGDSDRRSGIYIPPHDSGDRAEQRAIYNHLIGYFYAGPLESSEIAEDTEWKYPDLPYGTEQPNLRDLPRELPRDGHSGGNWKYWVPLEPSEGSPDRLYNPMSGGFPNFVPGWELLPGDDGKHYHIDDKEQRDEVLVFEPVRLTMNATAVYIPYSFMSPRTKNGERSRAGLEDYWGKLESSLGNLFSVPSDGRVPLAFERDELRLRCADNEIDNYLRRTGQLLGRIEEKGGLFFVRDFDHNLTPVTYRSENKLNEDWHTQPSFWKAAWPSLLAEKEGFSIPPVVINQEVYAEKGCATSQWYRLICCTNLALAVDPPVSGRDLTDDVLDQWRLLINEEAPHIRTDVQEGFRSTLKMHLFCDRHKTVGNPFQVARKPFHITWFAKVETPKIETQLKTPFWKLGGLYGDNTFKTSIQERAFTLAAFFPSGYNGDFRFQPSTDYWTILLLAPSSYLGDSERLRPSSSYTFLLDLIARGLENATDDWNPIVDHISSLLNYPILDPASHDELLYDDDAFTRSRMYFWAVNSLEVFIDQIKSAVEEWDHFWEASEKKIRAHASASRAREEKILRDSGCPQHFIDRRLKKAPEALVTEAFGRVQFQARRLEDLHIQFEALHKRASTLREGLFNASGVIESRASTRLGENVKLLTYVSIFFLPLAFCVGLWSTNESYPRAPLIITTATVGVVTYLIVANLNGISNILALIYGLVQKRIVKLMKDDEDKEWSKIGGKFSSFRPEHRVNEVSEWYIAYFLLAYIARTLKSLAQSAIQRFVRSNDSEADPER
ncbi:hypothetical protein IQ07DRAFT_644514 [Pyrenochaeta sp. DS3sAY3a]|nr:hypothetical protein IQ07DRAFT_644514 [Pyrenochaeta sp. DS3sAY3a]